MHDNYFENHNIIFYIVQSIHIHKVVIAPCMLISIRYVSSFGIFLSSFMIYTILCNLLWFINKKIRNTKLILSIPCNTLGNIYIYICT